MKIEERIDEEIRGGKDEWWRRHSRKEYIKMAKELVKRGFTEEEAVNFLHKAFWAAASEFGGDKV